MFGWRKTADRRVPVQNAQHAEVIDKALVVVVVHVGVRIVREPRDPIARMVIESRQQSNGVDDNCRHKVGVHEHWTGEQWEQVCNQLFQWVSVSCNSTPDSKVKMHVK